MKSKLMIDLGAVALLLLLISSGVNAATGNPAGGKPLATSKVMRSARPPTPPSGLYRAIKMASARDGWIVGAGGLIKRYMTGQWLDYPSPVTTTLNAVAATPTDAWIVGAGNTILHLVGNNWQLVASPAPAGSNLVDVDIVAPGEVRVIGSPAVMLYYSGGSWALGPTPPAVGPISWGSPTDAWMVDGSTTAYHYSDGVWSSYQLYEDDGNGHPILVPGLSVYMLDTEIGWMGVSIYGSEASGPRWILRYQGGVWQPICCNDAAAKRHSPAAPACTYWTRTASAIIGFADGTNYYGGTWEISHDCVTEDYYIGLWLMDGMIGQTFRQPNAISGVAENDLWLLDGANIYHWDGSHITTAPNCANPYTDVPANYYALSQIEYLTCHGIVAGTGNNTFSPNASASRIQFAKMISLARGWPLLTPSSGQTFTDVSPSNPLYPYVEAAYANGAISGAPQAACTAHQVAYPCFLPNDLISRAQAALITVRAFGWPIDTTGGPHFSDVPADNYAYAAIETCYHRGIVNGIGGGLFAPNANVTRAQLAVMLYKALMGP